VPRHVESLRVEGELLAQIIDEVVEEADCGLLVQPEDTAQIAAAMARLLHDPQDATRMGQNGLRAAREKYTWQAEEKKLLSLYQTLLGTSPAAP
jgi:glycosyltransferase involved in cell wall biosynthesis